MKTTTKNTGIKVKANVKAGALNPNHSRRALSVKSGLKAGALNPNHSRRALSVKSGLKAGATPMKPNHTSVLLAVK